MYQENYQRWERGPHMETPNSSTKKNYSKFIVILVILLNVIFAAVVFAAVFLGFQEPEALIIAWYAFTGTELLSLAGIKISDNKYSQEDSDEQPEDKDE